MTGPAYAGQPRITLECAPEIKTRLMLRLVNWATDETGQLDPGIEIRTGALRDRHYDDKETGRTVFDLAFGLFARYGDPPFTAERGQVISWWQAPQLLVVYEEDLDPGPWYERAIGIIRGASPQSDSTS